MNYIVMMETADEKDLGRYSYETATTFLFDPPVKCESDEADDMVEMVWSSMLTDLQFTAALPQ